MSVRAKFQLQNITNNYWSPNSKTLKFVACYDSTIPEDQRFAKATPSGSFEMQCDNPAATDQLVLGQYYYFDISPAPATGARIYLEQVWKLVRQCKGNQSTEAHQNCDNCNHDSRATKRQLARVNANRPSQH